MNIKIPWKYIVLLPAIFLVLLLMWFAAFPPKGDSENLIGLGMLLGPVCAVCFVLYLIIKSKENKN